MHKGRLEAFSDGVLAIIITIMVLEMKAPESTDIKSLLPIIPIFLSYILSFIYVGIYWINHHHIFQAVEKVNARILWANLNLLFWLSLIPFTTSWLGENHLSAMPVALYGCVLFISGISYRILEKTLAKYNNKAETLLKAVEKGKKENISIILYLTAIPSAFLSVYISIVCYLIVAMLWIIPHKRIEEDFKKLEDSLK